MDWIRRIVKTPIEPEDKDVFWLDISVPNYAVLKYYENGEWKIVRHSEDGIAYILPVGGIPYSDLSQDVKNRIDLAKEQSDWNQSDESAVDYIKNKPNVAAKADKVEGATAGNLASLDEEGNITDSGISKDFIEDNYQHLYHCTLQEVLNPKDGDICIVPVSYDNIPITGTDDSNIFNFISVHRKVKWRVTNGAEEWFFFRWTSDNEEVITTPSLPENVTGFPIEGIVNITNSTGEVALIWDTEFRSSVQYLTLYDVVPETAYLYIAQDWVKLEDINKKGPDNVQQIYNSPLSEVTNPKEGDICVVPGHEDSISISLEPGASLISFNVPYKTLRWAVDESVQTTAIAEIRYKGSLTNYYLYQPIPTGEEDVPTVFGGTIEADRSEFALTWDDDEIFAANLQYISLYSVIPDLAYVYRSGNWERIEDMSDVLKYSFQSLTSAQQKQARENILAFPGPFENKTTITSNLSLAQYIRYNCRTVGVESFTFNGVLSDGDTNSDIYKVVVITTKTYVGSASAGVQNFAHFVLIEKDDYTVIGGKLYRVVEAYEPPTYRPVFRLEEYYIKPQGGIPASDLASGVIPDVSNFITNSVNDLVNYYLKSETYTKAEVEALIGAIQHFHYEIYASTSAVTNPQGNVLYLIGPTGSGSDRYEEYVYTNNTWKKIGDTSIDLSGYVTTTALNTALAAYTTTANLTTLLAGKQDVISDLATIRSGAAAGATAYQKPSGGIPKTDLASGVQDSLDLADESLQYTLSGQVDPSVTPGSYVTRSDIVDNLTTDDATKILSAKQGKVLGDGVSQLGQEVNEVYTIFSDSFSASSGWLLLKTVNLKKGNTYKIAVTLNSSISSTFYFYLQNSSSSNLKTGTIAAGSTTFSTTYTPSSDLDGCQIKVYCGVAYAGVVSCEVFDKKKLVCIVLSEDYVPASITRDSSGNVSAVSVLYRDGSAGSMTITRNSNGDPTQVVAVYGSYSVTITLTRDSSGNVTSITY